jgi:hypothetical protein
MVAILPTPPVPDLARVKGDTVVEATEWLVEFYNTEGAPFNYRRGTRIVRDAYKGLHRLHVLEAGCAAERTVVGRVSNRDVVRLAAPLAFERTTQVFDLSPRRFHFGQDRSAAYRVPFFFVEHGVIHVYFLQPRKGAGLEFGDLCMVATIVKKYLLDIEFFGQRCNIEFVDVGAPEGKKRVARRFNLGDMDLWSDERLADRLTLLSEALDAATSSGRIESRRRMYRRPEPEMPLFD